MLDSTGYYEGSMRISDIIANVMLYQLSYRPKEELVRRYCRSGPLYFSSLIINESTW